MAGIAGFEPTHDGVKVRCLTAWRHPNIYYYLAQKRLYKKFIKLSTIIDIRNNLKILLFIYTTLSLQ